MVTGLDDHTPPPERNSSRGSLGQRAAHAPPHTRCPARCGAVNRWGGDEEDAFFSPPIAVYSQFMSRHSTHSAEHYIQLQRTVNTYL